MLNDIILERGDKLICTDVSRSGNKVVVSHPIDGSLTALAEGSMNNNPVWVIFKKLFHYEVLGDA